MAKLRRRALPALVGTLALLSACAQQPPRASGPGTSVVVLPAAADGHVGAVVVRPRNGGKPVVVDKPYVEASLQDGKAVRTAPVDPKAVSAAYGNARAALPAQPGTYVVYFVEGTDELNPDAKRALDGVVADVGARPAPEIAVVGHTDFIGTDRYNDNLSLQRARRVRDLLIRRGIPAKMIQAAGRGKREPLVRHADAVAEPRNRRVEIIVR